MGKTPEAVENSMPNKGITFKTYDEFQKELEQLINKHSMENISDTPDFILAEYLVGCLRQFNEAHNRCVTWHKGPEQGAKTEGE